MDLDEFSSSPNIFALFGKLHGDCTEIIRTISIEIKLNLKTDLLQICILNFILYNIMSLILDNVDRLKSKIVG